MENPTIGLAFIAGLLSFVSPCVLPLVPAYIGYMGARVTRSVAVQVAGGKNTAIMPAERSLGAQVGILVHALAFVGGFTFVFVAFGLMTTGIISIAGPAQATISDVIGRIGGVIIIFFGLHFMGVMPALFKRLRQYPDLLNNIATTLVVGAFISLLIVWGFVELILSIPVLVAWWLGLILGGALTRPGEFWNKLINTLDTVLYSDTRRDMPDQAHGGLGSSALMGVVFAAGWTPCIGPIYGAVLNLAFQTGDVIQAVPLLTAYSIGLGVPFVLTALLLDQTQGVLRRLQRHMHKIELVTGALLVLIGLLVASGRLADISQNFANQFNEISTRVEDCGVGFFQGEVAFNQVGSCLGGRLIPLEIGQGTILQTLAVENPRMEFLFHSTADTPVFIEISNLDNPATAPIITTLLNADGQQIAQMMGGVIIDEDSLLTLNDVKLPRDGGYIVAITAAEPTTDLAFKLKIRSTPPTIKTSQAPTTETATIETGDNNVVAELANQAVNSENGIGSIEALAAVSDPIVGLEVGNVAPDFTISTDGGETMQLADLRGQVVLLNFWGTWCGPCRREMPEFQRIYAEHGEDDFTILAIAVRDTAEDVVKFRGEFRLTFNLALDEGNIVSDLYGIRVQPSTLMLNPDGVIVAKHYGMLVETQIQELVRRALS